MRKTGKLHQRNSSPFSLWHEAPFPSRAESDESSEKQPSMDAEEDETDSRRKVSEAKKSKGLRFLLHSLQNDRPQTHVCGKNSC